MPDGSFASPTDTRDSAPAQSPLEAVGLGITGGTVLSFSVTGTANHGGTASGPDGASVFSHFAGAYNGISNVTMPINALLGVFLTDDLPTASLAPSALDFGTAASRDFASISPLLSQVFFIGDGMTSTGSVQSFVAPTGATRLFLGTMDGVGWFNNTGGYTVTVEGGNAVVPVPATLPMLGAAFGLAGLALRSRRA